MARREEFYPCPIDGGRMPLLAHHQPAGRKLLRLFWCRYCELGFAVVGDERDGRLSARFTVDSKTGTIAVTGPEAVQQAVADMVEQEPERIARLVYAG